MQFLKTMLVLIILNLQPLQLIASELRLIDNLQKAQPGDYIVTSQNKTYSVLHVRSSNNQRIAIEEITVPASKFPKNTSWPAWVTAGAPNNTSWVIYIIDLHSGQALQTYALTKQGWRSVAHRDNILYTLLNIKFNSIPVEQRKRVGAGFSFTPRDQRALWQPTLIYQGTTIKGVQFDGWKTEWPKDGSDLSGMMIEAYLPTPSSGYPSYFPYWLQISGAIGRAKIHIVDTGSGMNSPASPPAIR